MTVSRSWGLASLMRCAERAVCKNKGLKTKTSEHQRPLVNMGEASTGPSRLSISPAEDSLSLCCRGTHRSVWNRFS